MSDLYFGVVEDRTSDPFRLCRYKVRINGIHSANIADIATVDLPWAVPIQNNSAAMSGIGTSATGYLQGSTVVIVFADEDFQVPMIVGAIGGVQNSGSGINTLTPIANALSDIPPAIPPANIVVGNNIIEPGYLGTLTNSQFSTLKATIAFSESGIKGYSAINSLGFLGKYQFGALFLEDMGYIVRGSYARIKNNLKVISDTANWTGKNGMTSKDAFLQSPPIQESCMDVMLKRNYSKVCANDCLSNISPPEKVAGVLMASHLKGAGLQGATGYIKLGKNTTDANGTSCEKYYRLGYAAICGRTTMEVPTQENINSPAIDRNT